MLIKDEPVEDAVSSPPSAIVHQLVNSNPKDVLFLPLYGQDHTCQAVCSVLRIEGVVCLLDCGWTEDCDLSILQPLADVAPYIDLVLLSHADVAHTGALPYATAHLGLTAPVYATLPVQHLGHLYLYELLASLHDVSDFDAFTFDDIDTAFDRINGVRFRQQIVSMAAERHKEKQERESKEDAAEDAAGGQEEDKEDKEDAEKAASEQQQQPKPNVDPSLDDVRFTAHCAGHSLGGAMWHITVLNQDFLYAVSLNLKNDRHLKGCSVQQNFHRPALLITDATCANRSDPDAEQGLTFCKSVVAALRRKNGHVLIPVDTATRVLELLLLLERYWVQEKLQYPLVFLCKTAVSVLAKVKAQLEFLSDQVQKNFTRGKGGNPFDLPHVYPRGHLEALNTLPNQSNLVVLAPSASLEVGLARELLFHYGWACDPANSIILPFGAGDTGSLTATLAAYATRQFHDGEPLQVDLDIAVRVGLTPEELEAQKAVDAEEEAAKVEAAAAEAALAMDIDGEGAGDDGALDTAPLLATGRENTTSVAQQLSTGGQTHDGVEATAEPVASATADAAFHGVLIDGFKVPEGAVAPMFPPAPEPAEQDEFGEVLDLVALCGRQYYGDEGMESDVDAEEPLQAGLDLPTVDRRLTKVFKERRKIPVRAHVLVFDFSSVISQSSFLSMVRHVAPRNLALIQRPPPATKGDALRTAIDDALSGLFSHIHTPVRGEIVTLPSTACYATTLTPELSTALERTKKVVRPPYYLSWLDAVVVGTDKHTGNPILGEPPPAKRDLHTRAGVFLGNMMVSDVTQRLKRRGVPVEVEGECAVVGDGEVVVRQEDREIRDEIVIEGTLSTLYYDVREEVYCQFRLVQDEEVAL